MDAVLKAGRRLFDLVLLDAVPVLPVADTVLMQDLVDGFQLVVRSRRTPREAIRDTLAKLRSDRFIGVVFNGHQEYRGFVQGLRLPALRDGLRRFRRRPRARGPPSASAARCCARPRGRGPARGIVRPGWRP